MRADKASKRALVAQTTRVKLAMERLKPDFALPDGIFALSLPVQDGGMWRDF